MQIYCCAKMAHSCLIQSVCVGGWFSMEPVVVAFPECTTDSQFCQMIYAQLLNFLLGFSRDILLAFFII